MTLNSNNPTSIERGIRSNRGVGNLIDIHCHILPGVDDGANSLSESLTIARQAAKQGIRIIIATPHHQNGEYLNDGQHIPEMVHFLNEKLTEANIPVEILAGQEIHINSDLLDDLKAGSVIPLTQFSRYVLIELPVSHVPPFMDQIIFDLQIESYIPIITNPELNNAFFNNPDQLYRLVKRGALTQVSAMSLVGKEGGKAQRFAEQLLDANLTHFIASNAHHAKKHGIYLEKAYRLIEKKFGKPTMHEFMENSQAVISNEMIMLHSPINIKRGGLFKIFK